MKESPRSHSRTPEGTATHTSLPRVIATRRVCFTSDIEGNHDQGADRGIVGRTRSTPGSAVTVQQDAEIAALKPQLSGRESAKPHTAQPSSAHVLNTRIISM